MLDFNNNLILIKGKDETKSIDSVSFDRYNSVQITFNSGKTYSYKAANVRVLKNPKITLLQNRIALRNKIPLTGADMVQFFDEWCRIVYKNGYHELVHSSDIQIVESALNNPTSQNCFDYFKQIAVSTGLKVEGHNILASRYEKIGYIRDDSIVSDYLKKEYENSYEDTVESAIFPFGFNLSQKTAVENALQNRLSVIEGPPGTGKTQTILNIIANAVMRGESVAVVSSNNSATANVYEKLQKYGVDFIAAPLGSNENKTAFIEHQITDLPDMSSWKIVPDEQNRIKSAEADLRKKLALKNEHANLFAERNQLQKEYDHFKEYASTGYPDKHVPVFSKAIPAAKILDYIAEHELILSSNHKVGVFRKFVWRFRYGFTNFRFQHHPVEIIFTYCQGLYYERRLKEITERIAEIESDLQAYNFDYKMREYTELSMMAFKAKLASLYDGHTRKRYDKDDLWKNSGEFIKDYPVILSTTYSLSASLSTQFVYDYVIVDEASQVDLATGVLALSCAKKAVIVGDLKQLPNVVNGIQKKITDEIFDQFDLDDAYRYSEHSLLSSVTTLFPDVARVLLREHYRCHPEIIGFCNQRFYNNELIILTTPKSEHQPLMVYRTVPGNHARDHINQRQIDVITNEVFPKQNLNSSDASVGIVTPYRKQAEALQKIYADTTVKADTADKFQGQERSVMIFSTVDNEIGEFASDPNRLNVAVSRAIDQFIVVTDGNDNDSVSPIHDLIGYIQYHNHEVINSEIHSVFDYLYKSYANSREIILKKYGRISDVESENLMYCVIRDVLVQNEFSQYEVVTHVPVRMILNDLQKLNTRELSFATNHLTHVDFLIFSKLTHQPIMVVEVDGFAYHNTEKQRERDHVKDTILQKYDIPIVRFSTIGNSESEKLIAALRAVN